MLAEKTEVLYGTVLLKAKIIMDFILESQTAPTLKQISDNVDMTKSTVLKILKTLEFSGYVRRAEETKQYYLGTVFLSYAQKVNQTFDIRQVAMPRLRMLGNEINETVNLGIVEDDQITLLDKYESTSSVYLVARIGGQMHMYSSSMGKSVLANYSPEKVAKYVADTDMEKLTDTTITDAKHLQEDIEKVKERGYAFDNEENQPDIFCVGFSLCKNDQVYGAFSVSMPKYRADEEKVKTIIELGKKAQESIINEL